jgi:methylated-DNA-protein-cysteine methyltransferase-like protein
MVTVKKSSFSEKVYQTVKKIPRGKVMTYGQVAASAGHPGAARAVGNVLHFNPYPNVPCHRVVNARGRIAENFGFGSWLEQKKRLLKEGVRFTSSVARRIPKESSQPERSEGSATTKKTLTAKPGLAGGGLESGRKVDLQRHQAMV